MQLAGGNSALALAMTVVSNLLGILIVSSHEEDPHLLVF
jgi:predicted Na+-dependent transporter